MSLRRAIKSSLLIVGLLAMASMVSASCGASGKDVSKPEIAAALKSFMEAFMNNDAAALPALLSEDCTAAEVAQLQSASQLVHEVSLGAQFNYTVDADLLIIEVEDDKVAVPLDQPERAVAATAIVNGQQGPSESPLDPLVAPPVFVRAKGTWKVDNCGELLQRGDEDAPETP